MDINITLLGEMITFALLIWVTMKYVWPPLTKAMQERQQKIASGLEAAERGRHALELAQNNIAEQLREAKIHANTILDQANLQANNLIEDGKSKAQAECARILAKAKLDVEQEINKAKKDLQKQMANLVIVATEKVLREKIDLKTEQKLLDQLIAEI